jgi:apolipoprotein N-acyltransferase
MSGRVMSVAGAGLAQPVKLMLAAVFGTVMMLSFAPSGAWWLTPFCMAGLFMLAPGERAATAFRLGLAFGLGWLGGGVWWLYPGLAGYSDAGPALAFALTAALAGYLALFPALALAAFAGLTKRCPNYLETGVIRWSAGAALWMLSEWTRANLFGGIPWLLSGTAHAGALLGALAPWAGVLGVGWVNAFVALALADGLQTREPCARRTALLRLATTLALVALACTLLPLQRWTSSSGKHLSLRLIQGNISQHDKPTPAGMAQAAGRYAMLAAETKADLTLMPETALPVAWDGIPPAVLAQWRAIARERGTALVIGTFGAHAGKRIGTNSAVAILPDGKNGLYDYRYDKVHLVPLGEQTWPWAKWLTDQIFLNFHSLHAGGPDQPLLALAKGQVALTICFDSLFDVATADRAREAGLLVNLTNFSWFDGTYAAAQHLQAGQMRARETGRVFVQVGNSGATAIAGPDGRLRARLPGEVYSVLDSQVEILVGKTPFMRFGNAPLLVASLTLLLYLGVRLFVEARRARTCLAQAMLSEGNPL